MLNNNTQAFFALVRAGLWEQECPLLPYGAIDFKEVYRLAREQSLVGVVAAGLEHVMDVKVPKTDVLQFVGDTLQLEQRNLGMNKFLGELVEKMCAEGIHTLLVKGQGIAQCYGRPLWRTCGDVDLFLDAQNYEKAKKYLLPIANSIEPEGEYKKHLGMSIDSWVVELHGNLRCGLSNKMDRAIDIIQDDVFIGGNVRSWMNGRTQVSLPGVDCDILFVFTHFIKHFYTGGLGLRQICDWCRLLWTYREEIDANLLNNRLNQLGLLTEWKAFGAFAVYYLGMPLDAVPFYEGKSSWKRKADKICTFILEVGNFGHNRDMSYMSQKPYLLRKVKSFGLRIADVSRHAKVFPMDSLRFFPAIVLNGLRSAANGE